LDAVAGTLDGKAEPVGTLWGMEIERVSRITVGSVVSAARTYTSAAYNGVGIALAGKLTLNANIFSWNPGGKDTTIVALFIAINDTITTESAVLGTGEISTELDRRYTLGGIRGVEVPHTYCTEVPADVGDLNRVRRVASTVVVVVGPEQRNSRNTVHQH
jgi:hypothetical protein